MKAYLLVVGWFAIMIALFLAFLGLFMMGVFFIVITFILGNPLLFFMGLILIFIEIPVMMAMVPTAAQLREAMFHWSKKWESK